MRKAKSSDTENLTTGAFEHVIKLLNPTDPGVKPWTKKDACAYLGITYNTTRLASLIEKYLAAKKKEAEMRAEKRGKPATEGEICYIISSYLEGGTIEGISSSIYRTPTFVKNILAQYQVPIRQSAHSYFRPELVPEGAMQDTFEIGEKVYSMRYDSLAVVKGFAKKQPNTYLLYLLSEKWKQFAYQPNYELASLKHLKAFL